MAAREDLSQHGELRAAAAPRLGRAAGRAGRLARRAHELGALGRAAEARRAASRACARCRPAGGDRRQRVGDGRPGRRGAAGRRARALGRERVHLGAVAVPGPGPRRRGATRAARPQLAEAIDAGTDVVAFSAVQSCRRRGRRPRCDHGGGRRTRGAHGRRRDPGLRLAAARRLSLRRRSSARPTSGCCRRAAGRS